jgi:AcrR family transcriptional regulator
MLSRMVRSAPQRPAPSEPAPPPSKRPGTRSRLDVDERRAQLLGLGLAMFSERSYDEVSVDDLARAAGVSKGLLYHYFPTKRDLYVAAIGEAARNLLEVTTRETQGAPEERLRRGLSTYLDFVERRGKAYVALMRGGVGSDPEVAAILEETRRTFAAHILEHVPREDMVPLLETAVRGWIGFVEATSLDWVSQRSVPRDALVELLAAVIFDVAARATALAAPMTTTAPRDSGTTSVVEDTAARRTSGSGDG